jgi:hypothetical protein
MTPYVVNKNQVHGPSGISSNGTAPMSHSWATSADLDNAINLKNNNGFIDGSEYETLIAAFDPLGPLEEVSCIDDLDQIYGSGRLRTSKGTYVSVGPLGRGGFGEVRDPDPATLRYQALICQPLSHVPPSKASRALFCKKWAVETASLLNRRETILAPTPN